MTANKFIVALLGVVLYVANAIFGFDTTIISDGVFESIVAFGTAMLVYFVPNKES